MGEGGVEVQLHSFSKIGARCGGWSTPPSGRFTHMSDRVPIVQEAGWIPGQVWTGTENLAPTAIQFPDRPSRSQSLFLLSYPGPQTTPSAITSGQNSIHRSHCRTHGHATCSAQMLKSVRLKSRLFATRRLVIGHIIFSSLRFYPSVTSHRSASVRILNVVCVRTRRHQTPCLIWAANRLLVSVCKFPELAAQRTEGRQVKCHCSRQHCSRWHCTLHTAHCSRWHCTLHTAHCSRWHYTLHTAHCSRWH